jgi:hypothetical protein
MKTLILGFRIALFPLLLLLTINTGAFGERVNMPPAWLKETATHVIIGTVTAVY